MKTHSAHAICNQASLEIHASLEIRAFDNISENYIMLLLARFVTLSK